MPRLETPETFIDRPAPATELEPGERVAQGARLAILEAMKMEHTLTAGLTGTVAEIRVQTGDQVTAGAPLILLAPEEEGAA